MPAADLVFRNALLIDGTGAPRRRGHLSLRAGRIDSMVPCLPGSPVPPAKQEIDAQHLVLCPGFIDIHGQSVRELLVDGRNVSKVSQGITTEIMGETWVPAPVNEHVEALLGPENCWPRFHQWLDVLVDRGVSPNVGSLVPGHNVRASVMGLRPDRPDVQEIRAMQRVVAQAMNDGALGVGYALIYPPDVYACTEEIIEVCKVVAEHGGIYCTHIRSEGDRLLEGLEEAITIGQSARIPVEIYHLKACGRRNWHKLPAALERIELARQQGVDIAANMYPYTASGTGLTTILPPWAAAHGDLYANLDNPVTRQRIREEIFNPDGSFEPQFSVTGAAHIMPLDMRQPQFQRYIGWTLDRIAHDMGLHPIDAAIELLRLERQRIFSVFFKMSEENLELQMRQPWVKFSTDAPGFDPAHSNQMAHPRSYGSMPRVLGHYVRQRQVLSLEDAIARMTSHVAQRLRITDRGQLRPGAMADLVLFDPQTITDRATFEQPHQLSQGIVGVWVNGTQVWNQQGHTGATPGQVVRGSSASLAPAASPGHDWSVDPAPASAGTR